MKTTRTLSLLAATFFLLAPVAHAQQADRFHPAYFSIMGGAYVPEGADLDGGVALFLTQGFMMNPFIGYQADIGGFETSGNNNLQQ